MCFFSGPEADSARHVVSMGKLFSCLRTPDGGQALRIFPMHACHAYMHVHAWIHLVGQKPCGCLGTSDLLTKMKSWSCESNWSRNLHNLIFKFNMTLPVKMVKLDLPVRWKNKHVMMPWPSLPLSSWVECIFKKTRGEPLLAGKQLSEENAWKKMFQNFWNKFKGAKGASHRVFTDHAERLEFCCPIMLHGDEGRGKLHRAVMSTSVQPVLVEHGHAGHSFNSRFLHSIMPGELYEGDHANALLQEALVEDLRDLYTNGFQVSWMACMPLACWFG